MQLSNQYKQVQTQINSALSQACRKPEEITLIAVSKTYPVSAIREVYQLGQLDFGENKPQEIRDKSPELPEDIRWHMIGHLQSNKIKYVVGKCELIHSVDSIRLMQQIDDYAFRNYLQAKILLQVDIAKDGNKQGLLEKELPEALEICENLKATSVHGLMTIAPFVTDAEQNRWIFRKLRQISVDIQGKNYHNVSMDILSMGMSNDFEIALQEGATHIRIGTAIFGNRKYN